MTDATAAPEPVATSRDATPPPPPALRPRRWLGVLFWAAMVGLFGWLWPRSHQTADLVAAYTRAGNVQGVLSHRGRLLVAVSTLSFGPDKALTAEHVWAPPEDGDGVFADVFDGASTVRQRWGFGYALGDRGSLPSMPEVSWSAVVFPHWAALAACALVLAWHLWRFVLRTRERRWHKRGRCANCGYDLRGAASDRCPECGAPVLPPAAAGGRGAVARAAAARAAATGRSANVTATVLLVAAGWWAARLYLAPLTDAARAAADEQAAGLDRRIDHARFDHATKDHVIAVLRATTGLPLPVDDSPDAARAVAARHGLTAAVPVEPDDSGICGELWNVRLHTALAVANDLARDGLRWSARGGRLLLDPPDDGPVVVRALDVGWTATRWRRPTTPETDGGGEPLAPTPREQAQLLLKRIDPGDGWRWWVDASPRSDRFFGGRAILVESEPVQRALAAALAAARRADGGAGEAGGGYRD